MYSIRGILPASSFHKVFKALAPATVLSASTVDEKMIERVSKYYRKNSKLLVCLVQQFPLPRAHFIHWDLRFHTYIVS